MGRRLSGRLSRVAAWALLALSLAAAAAAIGAYLWRSFESPLRMSSSRVEIRIANGATARSIAHAIRNAGVDLNELEFIAAARATGATRQLRAGRYAIEQGMSLRSLVEMLESGDVLHEHLTIVEGSTFRDLRDQLAATPELTHDTAALSDAQLLKAIGATRAHAEGLFAPDTYVFDPGSGELEVLRRAYRTQSERLAAAWSERSPDLPYHDAYEALIMASLIEKETGRPEERRTIAGVFVNRQRRGMPLQTDPAVIYGLGELFDGRLHRKNLETDTPYNTYLRAGLPPTPIALPGRAAIEAALRPEKTPALYFVARGDGSSEFSATLAEHNRAVDRYQRAGSKAGAAPSQPSLNE